MDKGTEISVGPEHQGHEGHSSCSRAEISKPQDSLINYWTDWTFLDPHPTAKAEALGI